MTSPTIYFAANEDEAMVQVGGGTVVTTAGTFRSSVARCALSLPAATSGGGTVAWWQNETAFSASQFWQTARINSTAAAVASNGARFMGWADANGIERIRIDGTGTAHIYQVHKSDSSGTLTSLGSTFTYSPTGGSVTDKIDVFINDAVSGQISVYINGSLVYNFTGDTTTNSVTTLAFARLALANELAKQSFWSELIISDTDTRSWSLQTLQPVANGNAHNFDTGTPAASNVNEITLDDSTYDGSTTAGQIDQYTIPSIASGYVPVAIGVSARMAKGATGPSKMDLGVRTGGTDYWSSDLVLSPSLLNYQNWWTTNPNTSAPWAALPDNIGLKSVT